MNYFMMGALSVTAFAGGLEVNPELTWQAAAAVGVLAFILIFKPFQK